MTFELEVIGRLVLAAVLGAVVGYQREKAGKHAGLRTQVLIAVGACLFTITSLYGFGGYADPSRVAAGVVVGVGFLGAGTIVRRREVVEGLTTAASIWAVAAIGLGVGTGFYLLSIVATFLVLGVLLLPHRIG